MKLGGVVRDTFVASAVVATMVVLAAGAAGHVSLGLGLGAGLVIGSFNGRLVAGSLEVGAPFVATSLVRMAAISAIAILAAVIIGSAPWTALIGVGAAQFIMVAASVREGLRA